MITADDVRPDLSYDNIIGERFGKLRVIAHVDGSPKNLSLGRVICRCDCGKITNVMIVSLYRRVNPVRSCGCARYEQERAKRIDMILHKKFGMLTPIRVYDEGNQSVKTKADGYKPRLWLCKCDCGNTTIIRESTLMEYTPHPDKIPNCGCWRISGDACGAYKHGYSKLRIYRLWLGIIGRCYHKTNKSYKEYGGAGIYVDPAWYNPDDMITAFECFRDWSYANGYDNSKTIDRYPDRHGPYFPSNCRWVTSLEQSRNRDCVHHFRYNGEEHNLRDLVNDTGMSPKFLQFRIKNGWSYNAIIYSYFHRSLLLRRKGDHYVDYNGFTVLIPSNITFIPKTETSPAVYININGKPSPYDQSKRMPKGMGVVIDD